MVENHDSTTLPPSSPSTLPPVTGAGSTLYLAACSGFINNSAQIDLAIERLSQTGYSVQNIEATQRRFQRFAGTDGQRLNDLHQLLEREKLPEIILAIRGGYGAARLLPNINYRKLCPMLKESGSLLIGYSDFSAIQLALLAQGQVGSFAGPMLGDFGAKPSSSFSMNEFFSVTTTPNRRLFVDVPQQPSRGEGIFWGGNLSVLSSLVGTPYLPAIKGGLLFLEDVGEATYRIERMLLQLHQAGILKQQSAILLGNFNMNGQQDSYDEFYNLDTVINEIRYLTGIPVLTGIPFGHIRDKTTLPLGFPAQYQAGPEGLTLHFEGYPTVNATHLQAEALQM
ncbi:LD-carboxypeptidase [Neisseriaceae bacterium TC5R-5]|nr:LD-carboxypeptidase [Neisseriaceae bacterium TC5R-5]